MPSGLSTYQTFANNFNGDALGDPRFVNATPTPGSPFDTTYPNLNLQSSSPAINYGTYLTRATGSGTSSQTLIVNDARFFQDGTFAPIGMISSDWIAVGTMDNVAQISSIQYSTNTITLASPMTWADKANIWLYKKSDGARVLYGSAPDVGAYEFLEGDTSVPSAPTNLRISSR